MNYVLGVAQLFFVVILWTAVNEVTQDVYFGGYQKPFLVTYLNTGSFVLYLVPYLPLLWRRKTKPDQTDTLHDVSEVDPLLPAQTPNQSNAGPQPLTVRETAILASKLWVFYFTANCFQNTSFAYTTVASSTILTSMSGFFSLFIAPLFGVESFKWSKLFSVAVSFAGVALVSLSDANSEGPVNPTNVLPSTALFGDILALGAAIFWATYVVLIDSKIGDTSRVDMSLFFGFVGLTDIVVGFFVGLFLHLTGLEPFELPPNQKTYIVLVTTSIVILVTDFVYAHAALNTTPLVVTLGMTLPIPLAVVWDTFTGKPTTMQVIFGALLVAASFAVIGVQDAQEAGRAAEGGRPTENQSLA